MPFFMPLRLLNWTARQLPDSHSGPCPPPPIRAFTPNLSSGSVTSPSPLPDPGTGQKGKRRLVRTYTLLYTMWGVERKEGLQG